MTARSLLTTVAAFLVTVPAAQGAAMEPFPLPAPDGDVITATQDGPVAYIGGRFTTVSRPVNGAAVLDAATGRLRHGLPGAGRFTARAAVSDGAGGWYVGGETGARSPLVHWLADGRLDPAFDPGLADDAVVNALVLDGARLYVGGTFEAAGGQRAIDLAALDAHTGRAIPGFDGGLPAPHPLDATAGSFSRGQVTHLAIAGGALWVATRASTQTAFAGELRRVDPVTGGLLAPPLDAADGVDALAVGAGNIFAAIRGPFSSRLLVLDAATGQTAEGFAPPVPASGIDSRVVHGGVLALGSVSSGPGALVAADPRTGAVLDGFASDGVVSSVWAVGADDAALYASGAGGEPPFGVAALDPRTGARRWVAPADDGAHVLVGGGQTVFAGGRIASVGGASRPGIAAIDLRTGELVESFRVTATIEPCRMALAGPPLVVQPGRSPGTPGPGTGCSEGPLLAFSRITGEPVTSFTSPVLTGVRRLAGAGDRVVLVTRQTGPGPGLRAKRVTTLGLDGRPIGPLDRLVFGRLRSISVSGDRLYVAGRVALDPEARHCPVLALSQSTGTPIDGFRCRPRDDVRGASRVLGFPGGALLAPWRDGPTDQLLRLRLHDGAAVRDFDARLPVGRLKVVGERIFSLTAASFAAADLGTGAPLPIEAPRVPQAPLRPFRGDLLAHGDIIAFTGIFDDRGEDSPAVRRTAYLAGWRFLP